MAYFSLDNSHYCVKMGKDGDLVRIMDNPNEELKKRLDEDIVRCKKDILRAKDIIPPYGIKHPAKSENPPVESAEEKTAAAGSPAEEKSAHEKQKQQRGPIRIQSLPRFDEMLNQSEDFNEPEPTTEGEYISEIPQFNLAEQMMAEQRKVSATKRQGPGRKVEQSKKVTEIKLVEPKKIEKLSSQTNMVPPASPQHRIIADIVARDIAQFSRVGCINS